MGQENIETVHEANTPYKPRSPSADRVAVLWKVPTAHIPNTWKGMRRQGKYELFRRLGRVLYSDASVRTGHCWMRKFVWRTTLTRRSVLFRMDLPSCHLKGYLKHSSLKFFYYPHHQFLCFSIFSLSMLFSQILPHKSPFLMNSTDPSSLNLTKSQHISSTCLSSSPRLLLSGPIMRFDTKS